MSASGSVTQWIRQLEEGEEEALADICRRYQSQLEAYVRKRYPDSPHDADHEEIVVSAFWDVYRGIREGRTTYLANRYHFWALITQIAACRMRNEIERVLAKKRGGGHVKTLSALQHNSESAEEFTPDHIPSTSKTPQEEAILREAYERYLDALPGELRPFAELYLAGHQQREISERMECSQKTVQRKCKIIFLRWQQMAERELNEPNTIATD